MSTEEALRLRALARSQILDTPPEPEFDELTALAANVCETPMAIITLVDEKRQWFKSQFGLTLNETPRDIAFCNITIQNSGLTVIEDAFRDSRFADNPLVHANLGIRFYAGVPLVTEDGSAIGTLAVLDTMPRRLLPKQTTALRTLARSVMNQIELRRLLIATRLLAKTEIEATSSDPLIDAMCKTLQRAPKDAQAIDVFPGLLFWTDETGKILRHNPKAARFVDFFGATVRIQDLIATEMRAEFIERQQNPNETAHDSFKTMLVDPETGRLPYLLAFERWGTEGQMYLCWAALPLPPDDLRSK